MSNKPQTLDEWYTAKCPAANDTAGWIGYAQGVVSGRIRCEPPAVAKYERHFDESLQRLTGGGREATLDEESDADSMAWEKLTDDERHDFRRWVYRGRQS